MTMILTRILIGISFGFFLSTCDSNAVESPVWPAADALAPLDSEIHAPKERVLTLEQARSLYDKDIDWSDDAKTQAARLQAVARIEALIERYLDPADAPSVQERRAILKALTSIGAPPRAYEAVLLYGGVKKEFTERSSVVKAFDKNFKPLPEDPEKDQPLEITVTVALPKDYSPYKRYPLAFGGGPWAEEECLRIANIVEENSHWKAAPIYMTWRGRAKFNALFKELSRQFSIDPDRIAVGGYSVGGTAALRWALYLPDRFCAVDAQAGVAPSALDLPFVVNYKPIPVWLRHEFNHTHTPPEIVKAFQTEAQKAGVALTLTSDVEPKDSDAKAIASFKEAARASVRDLYAKHIEFANNDAQVNRKAWVRVDEYETRDNPELALKLHAPDGANKGQDLEIKKLRVNAATVDAQIDGNTVKLSTKFAKTLTLFLSARMLDLDKPITVIADGRTLFTKKAAPPSLEFMLEEARQSGRRDRAYWTSLSMTLH